MLSPLYSNAHISANTKKNFDTTWLVLQILKMRIHNNVSDKTHWGKEVCRIKTERKFIPV